MPTTISQLPSNQDFTQLDINNNTLVIEDPSLTTVANTAVQFAHASTENPTGAWVLNGQRITAGTVVASRIYQGYLNAESGIQTHLTAMSANANWARASASFANAVKNLANDNQVHTYSELQTLATQYASQVGVTPQQFMNTVLPNETNTSESYTSTQLLTLGQTLDQFNNSKLTDNSVLQNKLNVLTSNRQSSLEALTNIIKGWIANLQALRGSI